MRYRDLGRERERERGGGGEITFHMSFNSSFYNNLEEGGGQTGSKIIHIASKPLIFFE